ncbi:putative Proliferation-associated serine/threonine protein kinase [Balamuthia mandrillaris]
MLLSGTFKRHDRGGAITISNATQQRLTVGVEDLIDAMSSPATGVSVKDRKYHLKTYKKCFVGREAVDWLVQYLKLEDRVDAVSVGQELLRLKYFRHVVDDDKEFLDEYLFYKFMGGNRNKDAQYIIRSMEELYLALSDPIKGVTLADRKWRLKTYTSCFVASELVDWLMTNLPLRSREEAIVIGQKLQNRGYIVHVVNPKKEFKDDYLFYSFKVDRSETLNTLKNSRGKQRGSRRSSTSEGSSDGSDADISSIDAPTRRKLSSSQNQNAARAPSSDSEEDFLAAGEMENDQPQEVVSLTDFELLKILGVGAFGKVVMVKKKDNNQIYAMKVIHKEDVAISERSIRNLRSERDILTNDHPFLVHLHFSFQDENNLYLVMDYISGGDMFFHLRKHHRFSQKATQLFAAEILLALEHLHSFGIIYRDLKPENVLFDREGHVCLTDFGISKKLEEQKTKTLCGTPSYLAPEILKGQEYGESVDWWSLGVLALEMATGHVSLLFSLSLSLSHCKSI